MLETIHTKNDQPGNIMKQDWVLYELCLLLPLEQLVWNSVDMWH